MRYGVSGIVGGVTSRRIVFITIVVAAVVGAFIALGFETYSTWNGDDWRAEQVANDWWTFSLLSGVVAVFFYDRND